MTEDLITKEDALENNSEEIIEEEVEEVVPPSHPYDLPGEWFVLNAQSGHEKKVKTNILTRIKNLHLDAVSYTHLTLPTICSV